MTKNRIMPAIICILMTLAFICGCSGSAGTKIKTDTVKYETEELIIKCDTLEFSGMSDLELEQRLNSDYSCNTESIINMINGSEKRDKAGGTKYSYDNHIEIAENNDMILSIVTEEYIYTGGAHGNLVRSSENIYMPESRTLQLKDLFSDDSYKELLERKMNELAAANPEEYAELWEKPTIGDEEEDNFYIDDGHLVIYFQPYELSYYARGVVEFPVKLADISGYLKEEFRTLIQ